MSHIKMPQSKDSKRLLKNSKQHFDSRTYMCNLFQLFINLHNQNRHNFHRHFLKAFKEVKQVTYENFEQQRRPWK